MTLSFVESPSNGVVSFHKVFFEGSSSVQVYVEEAAVVFKECHFSGSSAMVLESSGNSNITLTDSIWSNSRISAPESLLNLSGGDVKMLNCTFFGNILNNSLVHHTSAISLEIDSCSFGNSKAQWQIIKFSGNSFSVRDSSFVSCSSSDQMIKAEALSHTFENSSFHYCIAFAGSLISISPGSLSLATDSSFSGVSITKSEAGAPLLFVSSSQSSFLNCKWEENTAALLAYHPSLRSNESKLFSFTFAECLISGNRFKGDSSVESSISLISIHMKSGTFLAQNNLLMDNSGTLFALSFMKNVPAAAFPRARIEKWTVQSGVGGISVRSGGEG